MRTPRLLAAVLLAPAMALVACTGTGTPAAPPQMSEQTQRAVERHGAWTWQPQADRLELGVTHTKSSLDRDEPADARSRGVEVLSRSGAVWQNHHLMGFGTLNPEPSPGEYDWSSLDARMRLTKDTRGRTVLTLCCSPDWMKGGEPGETDWARLEEAPEPEYFDEFAALSAKAVQRYPQIERVLVWNELKGFYHADRNRWDYERYTQLYNKVYTAVKEVRPDVQIGGPYAVLTSLDPGSPDSSSEVGGPWGAADRRALEVLDHWLENKVDADFVAVDAATRTRQRTAPPSADVGAQKYADLTAWIRERTDLAIWWAEFYPDVPDGVPGGATSAASAAATLAAVAAYAESGVSIALLWGPQGHELEYAALWTDSTEPGGGQPTPLTAAWQWLVPRLAEGEVEIGRSPALPLLMFRSPDGAVLVNPTGGPVEVADGAEPIPPWAVVLTSRGS